MVTIAQRVRLGTLNPGHIELAHDYITGKIIHTSIIIPAYNEEEGLPAVLKDVLAAIDNSFEVLVVDDGSTDATSEVASRFRCRLVRHEVNKGKGAAMQTGLHHARGENVIFIDADGTYPASMIPVVADHLDRYDLVRCVRDEGRSNIPVMNRLGNDLFDRIIRTIHNVEGGDMLSGLYGLKRRDMVAMRLDSDGFDIESEIMIKSGAMKLKAHSVPIGYNARIGEKKLNPVRDGLKILGRVMSLALMYNPLKLYVVPGLALWLMAVLAVLVLLVGGTIYTPIATISTNTLIVSAMAYLVGFQMVVFGCVINLYTMQAGLGHPNKTLLRIVQRFPRVAGIEIGIFMVLAGFGWTGAMVLQWMLGGFGPFSGTEALVISLSLLIWGIQILSTVLFLALFTTGSKKAIAQQEER